MESILHSVKKVLNLAEDYTPFDQDVIMHINSAFSTLNQLGLGPSEGFMIIDNVPTWNDFIPDDPRYNSVKSYVYLKVRMLFDPPATSFHTKAMEDQLRELEWRLNFLREDDVLAVPDIPDGAILDGGAP